jgi:hypothetical protein
MAQKTEMNFIDCTVRLLPEKLSTKIEKQSMPYRSRKGKKIFDCSSQRELVSKYRNDRAYKRIFQMRCNVILVALSNNYNANISLSNPDGGRA